MTDRVVRNSELFLAKLRPYMLPDELDLVAAAYVLAKYAHRNQKRDDGSRYFDHPRAVALIIIEELGLVTYWDLIVDALCHDVEEDTFMMKPRMWSRFFNDEVALAIQYLTKTAETKPIYYPRLCEHASWKVLLVKICDRLHNMRSLEKATPEKQQKQLIETDREFPALFEELRKRIPREHIGCVDYLQRELEKACEPYRKLA